MPIVESFPTWRDVFEPVVCISAILLVYAGLGAIVWSIFNA